MSCARCDLLDRLLAWLASELADRMPPKRPRPPACRPKSEGEDAMLIYELTLPEKGAPDVVKRELTQVVNGVTTVTLLNVGDIPEVYYQEGDQVLITLVDIDDAGNRSLPSVPLTFVAADTIPPAAPGQLTITLKGEEADPAPPPAPAIDPEVAEDLADEGKVEPTPDPAPAPEPTPEVPAEPTPEPTPEVAPEAPAEPEAPAAPEA